jgi:hypothetical protein
MNNDCVLWMVRGSFNGGISNLHPQAGDLPCMPFLGTDSGTGVNSSSQNLEIPSDARIGTAINNQKHRSPATHQTHQVRDHYSRIPKHHTFREIP